MEPGIVNINFLNSVLSAKGISPRQLSKLVCGDETHRDVIRELSSKPNIRVSTALRICRSLDISMDDLFSSSDIETDSDSDTESLGEKDHYSGYLRAQNNSLKLIIAEKERRIAALEEDKARLNEQLNALLQLGQDSDN